MKKCDLNRLGCAFLCLMLALLPIFGALGEAEDRTIYGLGDSGDVIKAAQQRLTDLGYYQGAVDGTFTEAFGEAIQLFQRYNNLLETGELDAYTRAALEAADVVSYEELQKQIEATEMMADSASSTTAANTGLSLGMVASREVDFNPNEYAFFNENRFLSTLTSPLSTFAADVDTASYAQLRAMLLRGEEVPKDSVRIEEMLNYFHYDYPAPKSGEPFGVSMEIADCPWNAKTKLLLIGLQAQEVPKEERPQQNLVFLIDVSGSMDSADKLPLVKRAFLMLLDQLEPTDTISIVTYASQEAVNLDGTPASEKIAIMEAINDLTAGGMTAGAAGIQTAYELAQKHFLKGGTNRILLATDGDLNIGVSDEGSLARMVAEKKESGVFLSVLGFGDGNYKDNKMEALADYGNGNYHYIDTIYEARKALVNEIGGTFLTVAKDVKLQLDFNPAMLKGYRLIGYEDRVMAAEDFADDSKDGGEIGSGHSVTVLYELVPADSDFDIGETESKYQSAPNATGDEWLTLSVRAKAPDGDTSTLYTYPLNAPTDFSQMSENLRFASAVAEIGMLLRGSEWAGDATYSTALELLRGCESVSGDVYKEEFLYLSTLLERKE